MCVIKTEWTLRLFLEHAGSPLGATAHPTTPMKYDYDSHTVGAGAPGNAYSGPIEGAAGPQPEIKYSCSVDFTRHQSGKAYVYEIIFISNRIYGTRSQLRIKHDQFNICRTFSC